MDFGLGIHGEPGISSAAWMPARELAAELVETVLAERPDAGSGRAAVVLNGLGATKYEELFVLFGDVAALLGDAGVELVAPEVGELVTSLDMAGCSLSVTWLDEELEGYWTAPADTPAFKRGNAVAHPAAHRRAERAVPEAATGPRPRRPARPPSRRPRWPGARSPPCTPPWRSTRSSSASWTRWPATATTASACRAARRRRREAAEADEGGVQTRAERGRRGVRRPGRRHQRHPLGRPARRDRAGPGQHRRGHRRAGRRGRPVRGAEAADLQQGRAGRQDDARRAASPSSTPWRPRCRAAPRSGPPGGRPPRWPSGPPTRPPPSPRGSAAPGRWPSAASARPTPARSRWG